MTYYVVDESEPHHMPWLHGDGIALMEAESVLWTLCAEIRRVVITPGARGKSPIGQMREEVGRILDGAADYSNLIDSRFAAPVLASLDEASMAYLDGRARNTGFDSRTWREIAPHITPGLFEAMMDECLDIERLHLDGMAFLTPDVGRLLRKRCADHTHWASIIQRFASAAQDRVMPGSHAVEVIEHFMENNPDAAWRHARSHAAISDDASLFLACARISGKGWNEGLEQIGNPLTARLCGLATSSHGRMRIFEAISDPGRFIERPQPAIKALLGAQ
jgi:hypothetical protein